MTINRRNRIRRAIASTLAERAGREAVKHHDAELAERPDAQHSTRCCERVYEDAARNEYAWLTGPAFRTLTGRVYLPFGLPALQRMLGAS